MSESGGADIASLGLQVDATQVDNASKSLDRLTDAGARAEKGASSWRQNMEGVAAAMGKNARATTEVSESVQKLLAKYDPLGAKLRSLQSDFVALDKAVANGTIGLTSDAALDKAYASLNAEIAKTKGLMDVAMGAATQGADKFRISANYAARELVVMGHEALNGQFSRIPGSFMSMLSHSNFFAAGLAAPLAGIVAIGAAMAVVATAAYDSQKREDEFNNALALSGNFANTSAESMHALAVSMAESGKVTVGVADNIVRAYVATGQIGGGVLSTLSNMTEDYARITGETTEKATEQLIKMFIDPKKGAEEFNKTTGELNVSELELIKTLTEQGRVEEAQLVLGGKMSEWTHKHEEEVGALVNIYRFWKTAISEAFASLGDFVSGQNPLEKQIEQQQALVDKLKENSSAKYSSGFTNPIAKGAAGLFGFSDERIATEQALLDDLKDQLLAKKNMAALDSEQSKINKADQANLEFVNATEEGRLQALRNQLKAVQDRVAAGSDADIGLQAEFAIQKKIDDLVDSMGSKQRSALQAQIEGRTQLQEVSLAAAQKENDAQLKLHNITAVEHEETKTFLELYKNALEQSKEQQLANVSTVRGGERQRHLERLANLKAEAEAIKSDGENALLEAKKKDYDELAKKIDELNKKELDSLDKKIAAQQLHNSQIGKTAEQKELENKAIEENITQTMEAEEAALRYAAATVGMSDEYKDLYLARANALDAEITKRKQLANLMGDAASLEHEAAGIKQLADDLKDFGRSAEHDIEGALIEGGKKGGKSLIQQLTDDFKKLVLKVAIQGVISGVGGALGFQTGASALGGIGSLLGMGGGGGNNILSMASNISNLSTGFMGSGIGGMYGAFAESGIGQALGLSTAASAGYAAPVYDAAGTLLSAGTGGSAGGLSALGSSIGTALPWIGGALALYSLFSGGKKEDPHNNTDTSGFGFSLQASGVSGPTGGGYYGRDSDTGFEPGYGAYRYQSGQTSGRGRWSDVYAIDQPMLTGLDQGVKELFKSGQQLAGVLGIDAKILDDVSVSSTKWANTTDALGQLSDQITLKLLPDVKKFQVNGDSLGQTAQRVANDLLTMDQATKRLGMSLNLTGSATDRIATVESIVSSGGGSQAFTSNLQAFYQNFFSDTERLTNAQKDLDDQFKAIGIATPATKDEFRKLVTGLDLNTKSGQTLFGQLIAIAPAFAQVADAAAGMVGALAAQISKAQSDAKNAVDDQISASNSAASSAKSAADAYRKLGQSLEASLNTLNISDLSPMLGAGKLNYASNILEQTFAKAIGGNADAIGSFPQIANQFLTASRSQNASGAAYNQDFYRVQAMFAQLQTLTTIGAAKQDSMASIADQQVSILTQIKDQLAKPSVDAPTLSAQLQQLIAVGGNTGSTVSLLQKLVDLMSQQGSTSGTSSAANAATIASMTSAEATSSSSAIPLAPYAEGSFVRDPSSGRVFHVESGLLRWIPSADIAETLYGSAWHNAPDQSDSLSLWQQEGSLNIPGYQTGIDNIPEDNFLLRGHKGEAVLNAPDAARWRSGERGITSTDLLGLREDIQRLTEAVERGNYANVAATESVATSIKDVANRAEVQEEAKFK